VVIEHRSHETLSFHGRSGFTTQILTTGYWRREIFLGKLFLASKLDIRDPLGQHPFGFCLAFNKLKGGISGILGIFGIFGISRISGISPSLALDLPLSFSLLVPYGPTHEERLHSLSLSLLAFETNAYSQSLAWLAFAITWMGSLILSSINIWPLHHSRATLNEHYPAPGRPAIARSPHTRKILGDTGGSRNLSHRTNQSTRAMKFVALLRVSIIT